MNKRFVDQLKRAAAKRSRAMRMEKMTDAEVAVALEPSRDPFLCSAEWKGMRTRVLATYGAKCMCCGRMPKDLGQINVDHIKCRRDFPELALDFENLQVLCGRCNKAKGNKHSTDYRTR